MSCFRWSMGEISSHGIECLPASSVARSVTHVPGLFCYPCPWTAPRCWLTPAWSRRREEFSAPRLKPIVSQRNQQRLKTNDREHKVATKTKNWLRSYSLDRTVVSLYSVP